MKTAGVVIDFYDDPSGAVLKKAFPSSEELPEVIKTAHILSTEEREVLRDEAFALVMLNEGKSLRKFACVDPGNTVLSVFYFMEHADRLPVEAQKTAAANLLDACEEFGIEAPELLKAAAKKDAPKSGMARDRDPMKTPITGDESDWAERTNLRSIQGSDGGRVIQATSTMKTASARVVDVSGLEAPVKFVKTSSSRHALGDKYALDSYADVKKAVEFFSESYASFSPSERHEYAVKTASRADELGIEVTEELRRYGSTDYAPDLEAHLANRRALSEKQHHGLYNELQEKRASIDPETFAQLLGEADEVAGLNWYYGGDLADPYFSTFGGNAAQEKLASWSWQGRTGDFVNAEQLTKLATKGREVVNKNFNSDFTTAFSQDPIAIFESMPDDSKAILARLAAEV